MRIITVVLAGLLIAGCSDPVFPGKWVLITDGSCYSYRIGTWINQECFASKEEAKDDMTVFKAFRKNQKQLKEKEWTDVIN